VTDRFAVPKYFPGRRNGETGQHSQQSGFSGAGRAQQSNNLAWKNLQVGRRNDLDAVPVRLDIELLEGARLDDRILHSASLPTSSTSIHDAAGPLQASRRFVS
jgi:hypothetical protein